MSNRRFGSIAGADALAMAVPPMPTAAGGHEYTTSDPPLLTARILKTAVPTTLE